MPSLGSRGSPSPLPSVRSSHGARLSVSPSPLPSTRSSHGSRLGGGSPSSARSARSSSRLQQGVATPSPRLQLELVAATPPTVPQAVPRAVEAVPKNAVAQAVEMFDKVDANGDGTVSRSELIKALRTDESLAAWLGQSSRIRQVRTRRPSRPYDILVMAY